MKIPSLKSVIRSLAAASVGVAMAAAATPPPVTNEAPAAGKRVKVTAPGSGYAGNPNVYHTLYLPTDWVPGGKYPVIVEYAPNSTSEFTGKIEDNKLGFYQSGGSGFIWVSMPCINEKGTASTSDDVNTTSWYGTSADDDVAYTKAAVVDIIENYGGDPASVLVTGFSRGAIVCGEIGCRDDEIADIWLAFLPHSFTDAGSNRDKAAGPRTDRIKSRPSFLTWGQYDGGGGSSNGGVNALNTRGFPVESYIINGLGHTDAWITDESTPAASGDPMVPDVRARMRAWIAEVIANKPGTHRISGVVTDADGAPVAGARVQSGLTHWSLTDATGSYELAGLVDGGRILTVSHPDYEGWQNNNTAVLLAGADLTGQDFQAYPLNNDPPAILSLAPANTSTDVAPSGNLVITFDKLVQKGTGDIVIRQTSGGIFETIPVSAANVTISDATVTIDPTADFNVLTGYHIEIASTAITDRNPAPNAFAGISGSGTWSFTTGMPDVTAPSIDTLNPANAASEIPVLPSLEITFDEEVRKRASGNIFIRQSAGGTFATIPIQSANVTVSGSKVTIVPSNPLANFRGYFVEIDPAALEDLFGNAFAGITGSATWAFTTAAPSASTGIITPVAVTSTSNLASPAGYTIGFTIDGGGLSAGGTSGNILSETHSNGTTGTGLTWLSAKSTGPNITVIYDLGGTFDVDSVHLWNWTYSGATATRGVNSMDISFSSDGINYADTLDNVPFTPYPSAATLATVETRTFTTVRGVTHIRLTDIKSNDSYVGFSEIRFGKAPNGFSDWIAGFSGLGSQTGLSDDPDGDGITNGIENFVGTAPGEFSQGLVAATADTGTNTFTFTHPLNPTPAADLTATYRWSKDLSTFTDDGNAFEGTTVTFSRSAPTGGVVTVTASVTGTPLDRLFVDIKVQQN